MWMKREDYNAVLVKAAAFYEKDATVDILGNPMTKFERPLPCNQKVSFILHFLLREMLLNFQEGPLEFFSWIDCMGDYPENEYEITFYRDHMFKYITEASPEHLKPYSQAIFTALTAAFTQTRLFVRDYSWETAFAAAPEFTAIVEEAMETCVRGGPEAWQEFETFILSFLLSHYSDVK